MTTKEQKILDEIDSYGGIDGAHHKQWLIDRVVRIITGDKYDEWVTGYEDGKYGPETYSWDTGCAP
ncbi:MAG: hypothetical protein DRP97_04260 [Candidatus Latescibacterota bacterium]|nr:MAG: hypothetical protein DRP97_04260 [Candidatus Latescibacterota bacterium]